MTRIVCPACNAAYEVPPSAIPPGGRDVQCAACGHDWYQLWPGEDATGAAVGFRPDVASDPAPWASRFDSGASPGDGASRDMVRAAIAELAGRGTQDGSDDPDDGSDAAGDDGPVAAGAGRFSFDHGATARLRAALRHAGPFPDGGADAAPDGDPAFHEAPQPPLNRMQDLPAPFGDGPDRAVRPSGPVPGPLPGPLPGPIGPDRTDAADESRRAPSRNPRGYPPESALFDEEPELDLPLPPRRKIDPAVLAVLRSEAEVEAQARRKEAGQPLESQDELPLLPQPRRSASEVRARLARLQEAERKEMNESRWTHSADSPSDPPEPDVGAASPRGLASMSGFPPLPPLAEPRPAPAPGRPDSRTGFGAALPVGRADVEPSSAGGAGGIGRSPGLPAKVSSRDLAQYHAQQVQRGFRIGFALPVAAVCVGLGLYLAAPRLMQALPDAEPVLQALVDHGDQVQARLASGILAAFDRFGAGGGS